MFGERILIVPNCVDSLVSKMVTRGGGTWLVQGGDRVTRRS